MKRQFSSPLRTAAARATIRRCASSWAILCLFAATGTGWTAEDMPEQLQELADRHHFDISGFEQLANTPARNTSGSLREQIRLLLENYNYILIGTPDGGIERIIVMGGKEALPEAPPEAAESEGTEAGDAGEETVLETRREGLHHLVDAVLIGPSGAKANLALTIDTGASFVVLPRSAAEQLGFAVDELEKRQVKTANGSAEAAVGTLPQILLGDASVEEAQVAFIEDEQLGDNALLGMSVLGRFDITLDDKNNQITLRSK
jgi:clan AA aspartic protease (TIGR02281 family)